MTEANPAAAPQVLRDADAEALYEHLADTGAGLRGRRRPGRARAAGKRADQPGARRGPAAQDCADANGLRSATGPARPADGWTFCSRRAGRGLGRGLGRRRSRRRDGVRRLPARIRAQAVAWAGTLIVTGGAGLLPAGLRRLGRHRPGAGAHEAHQGALRPHGHRSIPAASWGASDERQRHASGAPPRKRRRRSSRRSTTTSSPAASAASASRPAPSSERPGAKANVARGKVALYRNMLEDRTEIGPDTNDAFANCLLCRACTESCFSAVKTDEVVISFRHAYADRFGRGLLQRRVFRFLLPRPRLMRGLVRTIWALRRTGLPDLAPPDRPDRPAQSQAGAGHGVARGHAGTAADLPPEAPAAGRRRPAPGRRGRPARRPSSATGCPAATTTCCPRSGRRRSGARAPGQPGRGPRQLLLRPGRLRLRRPGGGGQASPARTCAGSATSSGSTPSSRSVAVAPGISRSTRSCWPTTRSGPSGPRLLQEKVRSFSEFVAEKGGAGPCRRGADAGRDAAGRVGRARPIVITYHEPCHLGRRYQNVIAQPRQILRSLRGLRVPGGRRVGFLLRSGRHLRGAAPGDIGRHHRPQDGVHQGHRRRRSWRPSARPA